MTTDNLPAKSWQLPDVPAGHEYRLPVIVCPFCGEKDPVKLALYTVNRECDVETIDMRWSRDIIRAEPTHFNEKITIEGKCFSCLTEFEISISARVPYSKLHE
jgi:hypothetical protein